MAARGRVRRTGPGTSRRFAACLAEATDPRVPVAARAARVYLDVAFVHPFPDGNARAAMLCLSFVLARDRIVLDVAAPVVRVRRRADDLPGAVDLVRLVTVLIDATRRRGA
ncbi:Fic family protein [Actinoplanes flavus]|uniref:Fic family protein n=1 Tax=Actinoplanes flavus TaxID=2820290 RepID=A0ABS3UIB9_9ACTN|nr:Fic family protein [Actinoplanes flavus]MBO3738534.1 Fic family protein [Actinoplanes flavus]